MKRMHALVLALVLALAAGAGLIAATRTTQLGASARTPRVSDAQIAQKNRQLSRIEAALRRQAAKKPPALQALPARTQSVVYVRPKPIVHVIHRRGGEHEVEGRDGAGLDD